MSIQNLTTADELLKNVYKQTVTSALNDATPLKSLFDVNQESFVGRKAIMEIHYGRNIGVGSRSEDEALPTAGYQKYKTVEVTMKQHYAAAKFSGPALAACDGSAGSFVKLLNADIMGLINDIKKEENRQLHGGGYGVLGRWRSGTGAAITLQKKYTGNSVGGDGFGSGFGAKYFKEFATGVPVVPTFSSGVTALTVGTTDIAPTEIDDSNVDYDSITAVDPSVTEAAGTFYVRNANLASVANGAAAGAARKEMMGIWGIVNSVDLDDVLTDGTSANTGFAAASAPANDPLQTLDVASYPFWKAQTDFISGGRYTGQRPLTDNLMQKMFDNIEDEVGEGFGASLIMTTKAIRREFYENQKVAQRVTGEATIQGGFKTWRGPSFNGIPILTDKDATDGDMYFLSLHLPEGIPNFTIYRMSDYDWFRNGSNSILIPVSGYDQYTASMFCYRELGVRNRKANGVIGDIAYEK